MTITPVQSAQDVVDFLMAQHAQIKQLFADVTKRSGSERAAAFTELRRLLAVHETAEEEIVHPRARHEIAGGEEIVEARLREENEAKTALAELEKMDDVDSTQWETKFGKLHAAVLAHAEAEERDEFAMLAADLDDTQLQRMRRAVELAEKMAPTRPHAGVESAAANLLVGPFAAMLDRARDAISAH
jgi:hemerythrin superfamily protein